MHKMTTVTLAHAHWGLNETLLVCWLQGTVHSVGHRLSTNTRIYSSTMAHAPGSQLSMHTLILEWSINRQTEEVNNTCMCWLIIGGTRYTTYHLTKLILSCTCTCSLVPRPIPRWNHVHDMIISHQSAKASPGSYLFWATKVEMKVC